ncbi:hypothetical protein T10_2651 [Trichinella papuae]|uniref:HAUS augmin-like complex subunit 6 N-terminal domain-containing protein n=1 Tax=Trichinella papuae TaxID=268474 RepID=A0A0V1MWU8_9BILA|nr:hypothetical protein T10_2651 [Trichinella papuae]
MASKRYDCLDEEVVCCVFKNLNLLNIFQHDAVKPYKMDLEKFEKIDRRDFYNFLFALMCHIHGFQDPLQLNIGCWPVITRKDEMQFLIFSNKWLADCQKALPNIFIWNSIPSVLCETTSPFFMDILLRISTIALLKCTWETYGNICIFPIKANEALDWLAMAEKESAMQQSLLTELKIMELKKKTAEDHIQRIEEVENDIAKLAEQVKISIVNDESCLKLNLPTLKVKDVKEIADHVLCQFSSALREREIYLESLKELANCLFKLEARISNEKHHSAILPLDGLSECFREKVTDSNGRFNLDNFFTESVKAIVSDPLLNAEVFQNAYLNLKEACAASNARAARLKAVKDVLLEEMGKFPVLKEKHTVHSLIAEQCTRDLSSDAFTKALFSLNEKPNNFDFQHGYSFSNDSNLTSVSSLLQLDISDITVHFKNIGHIL